MANECILVVDDDPEVIASLARYLRSAGYTTVSAPDGETALQEVSKTRPAVVISDVLMPGLNGFQYCRQLKATPATAQIPVILISGKTDPADHFWAKEVGARTLLRKPVDIPQLLSEITSALARPQ